MARLRSQSRSDAGGRSVDDLLSPGEVARILNVNPRTVTRWAHENRLPSCRTPGGHHRYRYGDVLAILRPAHPGEKSPDDPT